MKMSLSDLCKDFIRNRDIIKSSFRWENSYIYPVCAAIFTDRRQSADKAKLTECRDILKKEVGIFSNFRGTGKLIMISLLAADSHPDQRLKNALNFYSTLKEFFFSSQYLPFISMVVSKLAQPTQYTSIAGRTRHIYTLMRSEHPFLTSSEDSVFAALLAMSDMSDKQIVAETERCYRLLKPTFFSGNAVQSLSHVLALADGTAEDKCQKTLDLFETLKARGYKYGTGYELPTLGVLAMLPADKTNIIGDLIDVDSFLARQKGYGFWGLGRKLRLMHAGMLVASDYIGDTGSPTMASAAVGATVSLIAAQQAAMIAVIAASSAGASAAAAGS